MQKILQINAGSKIFGGVESFIFNYYKNIEKKVNCITLRT